MAGLFSVTATTACTASGGQLRVRMTSPSLPADPGATAMLFVQVIETATGDTVAADQFTGYINTFVFSLPDGQYQVEGSNQDGEVLTRTVRLACGSGSGGGSGGGGTTCDLEVSGLQVQAPTKAGGYGQVRLTTATTAGGPVTFLFTDENNVDRGTFTMSPGLNVLPFPPGAYTITVQDTRRCFQRVPVLIPSYVPPPPVLGCTDRLASNFNGNATAEDGTCVYTPAMREPVFGLPLLQSLRFVVEEAANGCDVFEHADNALFCQQRRPGQQLRPHYRQKVQACDPVRVQVLTNYNAVEATVRRHRDGNTLRTVALSRALQLEGMAPAVPVELYDNGDGYTRLIGGGGQLPVALQEAPRVVLTAPVAGGTYRSRSHGIDAATGDAYLVLNRPWQGNSGAEGTATWPLSGPGFDVWEADIDLDGLPDGDYEVRVRATDPDIAFPPAVAISEPLWLRAEHPNTVVLDYFNRDNAYGMVFTSGIRPRLRVDGVFFRPAQPGGTVKLQRNSDGSPVVLASTAQRKTLLETSGLPDWLHEKLYLVCRLDALRVNGRRRSAGEESYQWTPNPAFPLSGGQVALEEMGWLGAGNGADAGPLNEDDNLLELRGGNFLRLRGR